jgi:hypothetical protein
VRLPLARAAIVLGTAAGLLLSPRLWLTDRYYPTVPVWDGMPDAPAAVGYGVFGGLLALLTLAALLPRSRWPLVAFVILAAGWFLWDQTRWQPWFYQYLGLLAAVGFARRPDTALNVCRFVLAATYFWSGAQKLNASFASDMWPWMVSPIVARLPDGLAEWVAGQGWTAAGTEAALGVALLVPRLRPAAVPIGIGTHAVILFCLSPWGHDWNTVVWPWNVTLAALDVILFWNTRGVAARNVLWPPGGGSKAAVVLFGVMPAFSLVGWWDPYLSAALYSGNLPQPRLTLDDTAAAWLPPDVRDRHLADGDLDLKGWAMDELNVPGYPARRVFRGVARRLGGPPHVTLVTADRPDWWTGERAEIAEGL